MANEYEIKRLLTEVAEHLIGRRLSEQDVSQLYLLYQHAYGTSYQKSIEALTKFSHITERQIIEKRSSSDDLDRVMQELRRQLEGK